MEDWKLVLEIIVPIAAMFAWFIGRLDKRFDALEKDIRSIDGRLNRLEGAFFERGYWESRKTGTEEKK